MRGLLYFVGTVATMFAVGMAAAGIAWFIDEPTIAALIAALTIVVCGVTLMVAGFAVGSRWTLTTAEFGANIALRAQESNDRWDVAQIEASSRIAQGQTQLMKSTIEMVRGEIGRSKQLPALPLFGQPVIADDDE